MVLYFGLVTKRLFLTLPSSSLPHPAGKEGGNSCIGLSCLVGSLSHSSVLGKILSGSLESIAVQTAVISQKPTTNNSEKKVKLLAQPWILEIIAGKYTSA